MFQCVGQKPIAGLRTFTLTSEKLNKTMVLMSPDEGTTWNMLTRVPDASNRLLIAYATAVQAQGKNTNGYTVFFYDRSTNCSAPVISKNASFGIS